MHESYDDGALLFRRDLGRHRRGNVNATTFFFGAFTLGDKPFLDFLPELWFLVDHDALVFNLVVISLHASAFAFARPFSIRRNQFREPYIVPVDMEGTDFVPATLFLRPFADVPIPLRGIHQDRVDRVCRLADCLALTRSPHPCRPARQRDQ